MYNYQPRMNFVGMYEPHELLMYLRKSRSDDPNETVEEVLQKHETMLQEYALQNFGFNIPEKAIYREVCSGESIEDREEIKYVLHQIESPQIKGILVVEPERLSRGDLSDCATIINAFRFSKTKIFTLDDVFDLEIKKDRDAFQNKLLSARDFYEYITGILSRGCDNAAKRGCYISSTSGYGYERIKIGKNWTLQPFEPEFSYLKMMYEWADAGESLGLIGRKLDELGAKPRKADKWNRATILRILKNPINAGLIVRGRQKTVQVYENGKVVKKQVKGKEEELIVAKGLRPAAVSMERFESVNKMLDSHPSVNWKTQLQNPLAGLLFCAKCGRSMGRKLYQQGATREYYLCPTRPQCHAAIAYDRVFTALIHSLEQVQLPDLKLKVENNDGQARKVQERLLLQLSKQLNDLKAQEEKQYEMFETGRYTLELFDRRHTELKEKMGNIEKAIEKTRSELPPEIDYKEKAAALQDAIEILKDTNADANEKNRVLKNIIERIDMSASPSTGKKGHRETQAEFQLNIFLKL